MAPVPGGQGLGDHPAHRDPHDVGGGELERVEQARGVGGHVAEGVLAGTEAAGHELPDLRGAAGEVGRVPGIAVVEAHHVEAPLHELGAEVRVPSHHLHAQPHDQEERRVGRVAEGLVAERDSAADVAEALIRCGAGGHGRRSYPAGDRGLDSARAARSTTRAIAPARSTLLLTLLGLALALPATAGAATPIPPGPPTTLPTFTGKAAKAKPIRGVPRTYQNPFMAPNPFSELHNDAWQTDTYRHAGPLGRSPEVFSTYIGRLCGSITFDSRGRLVATCIAADGPRLFMFAPKTLDVLAEFALPPRQPLTPGTSLFQDFSGGAYFFMDQKDRIWSATTTRHILLIAERGATPGFTLKRDYDLSTVLREDERITSALPDSTGRIWFVSKRNGVVGTLDPKSRTRPPAADGRRRRGPDRELLRHGREGRGVHRHQPPHVSLPGRKRRAARRWCGA